MASFSVHVEAQKVLDTLTKLDNSITESDIKLWKNQAYAKYYKIETEKFDIENKLIDEQTRVLEGVEKTLRQAIEFEKNTKNSLIESLDSRDNSIIYLKERFNDSDKATELWCKKLDDEYKKHLALYHEHKFDLENSTPFYQQLKNAKNKTKLFEFELKLKEKEVRYEKEKYRSKKELNRKMFNVAIVQFAKAIQTYKKHTNYNRSKQRVDAEYQGAILKSTQVEQQDSSVELRKKPHRQTYQIENQLEIPPLSLPEVTNLSYLFNEQTDVLTNLNNIYEQDCVFDASVSDMLENYQARRNERKLMRKLESCEKINLEIRKPAMQETKPSMQETKPSMQETKPAMPETKPAMPETKTVNQNNSKRRLPIINYISPKKTKLNIIDNQVLNNVKKNPTNWKFAEDDAIKNEYEHVQKAKRVMFNIADPQKSPQISKTDNIIDVAQVQTNKLMKTESQKLAKSHNENVSFNVNSCKEINKAVNDKTKGFDLVNSKNSNVQMINFGSTFSPYFTRPNDEDQNYANDLQDDIFGKKGDDNAVFEGSFEEDHQEMHMATDQPTNFTSSNSFLTQEIEFEPFHSNISFNFPNSQPVQQSGFMFNLNQNDQQNQFDNTFNLF